MIETLLKNDLPQAYGLTRSNVTLNYHSETGTFELEDQVACHNCKQKFPDRNGCNERTMKIDASDNTITIVEYEDYINQFNGKNYANGGRCDLMMFDADNHKVSFCDLGCYSEEHVEKKQKKSHQQVCDSLVRFLRQPCGRTFINQFDEKVLIFGRRDPAVNPHAVVSTPARGNVKLNMQAFLINPFSKPKYAVSTEVVEGVNVNFVIVNYPETYVW